MAWIVTYKAENGKMVPLRFSDETEAREKRQELIKEGFDCGVGIDHVPDREVSE